MRILSRNQFAMSNFSREGYEFNEIEGTFKGTMQFAVWGRKCNAIAYVELDDGRKIMCTAFQQPDDYLGITEIDFGTRVEVVYERGKQCIDLKELTPTIVNTLIKRIDVHKPDEKFKHRRVKIDIYFTAVGLISIPDEKNYLL